MSSLSARLLISVSLLLVFFFGATIVVLDAAFRDAGEQAQEDILDGQLMALIAEAEPNVRGELEMPIDLREPRFGNLGSGLYGALFDDSDAPVWTSRSSLGLNVPYGQSPVSGTPRFSRLQLPDGTPLMALSLAVQWELNNGDLKPYTFNVAQSLDSFNAQLAIFRRQLFTWFAAVALIMLFSISVVMRGLLRPLRQIETEIREVEVGQRQSLSADFPTELTSVARNMNVLIGSERARSERYRNTLDNLAHSLKTPLAAIRARQNVRVTIRPLEEANVAGGGLRLMVEDDGPGIPEQAADALLKRGMRLDESAPGHGIGLSIVKDIAASYGGEITIAPSELGGSSGSGNMIVLVLSPATSFIVCR